MSYTISFVGGANPDDPPENVTDPTASFAMPLSSKSLAVIARSKGLPAYPHNTSRLFLTVSPNLLSCPDHFGGTGMLPLLDTYFLRRFVHAYFIDCYRTSKLDLELVSLVAAWQPEGVTIGNSLRML